MYKTIDIVIVDVCRILLCIFQTVGRSVSKLLFLLHCLTWLVDIIFPIYFLSMYYITQMVFLRIYLYLHYVPTFMLWSEEVKYAETEPGLWLWFAAECLDSVETSILHIYFLIKYYVQC